MEERTSGLGSGSSQCHLPAPSRAQGGVMVALLVITVDHIIKEVIQASAFFLRGSFVHSTCISFVPCLLARTSLASACALPTHANNTHMLRAHTQVLKCGLRAVTNFWDILDFFSIGLVLAMLIAQTTCAAGFTPTHLRCMAAVEVLVLFSRVLYFAMASDSLGSFVRCVHACVRAPVCVYACACACATSACGRHVSQVSLVACQHACRFDCIWSGSPVCGARDHVETPRLSAAITPRLHSRRRNSLPTGRPQDGDGDGHGPVALLRVPALHVSWLRYLAEGAAGKSAPPYPVLNTVRY